MEVLWVGFDDILTCIPSNEDCSPTSDGPAHFPGCFFTSLNRSLLTVPRCVRGTDQVGGVLQGARWKTIGAVKLLMLSDALRPHKTLTRGSLVWRQRSYLKGSVSCTSRAAPRIRPSFRAWARAFSSTSPPLDVFTRNAPWRICHDNKTLKQATAKLATRPE